MSDFQQTLAFWLLALKSGSLAAKESSLPFVSLRKWSKPGSQLRRWNRQQSARIRFSWACSVVRDCHKQLCAAVSASLGGSLATLNEGTQVQGAWLNLKATTPKQICKERFSDQYTSTTAFSLSTTDEVTYGSRVQQFRRASNSEELPCGNTRQDSGDARRAHSSGPSTRSRRLGPSEKVYC